MPLKDVRAQMDFGKSLAGVLVSHQHGDHAGHLAEVSTLGAAIYTNSAVRSIMPDDVQRCIHVMDVEATCAVGGFKVVPFELKHDVECYGFLIWHEELGKLLFVTDTTSCDYNFNGLSHIMIEANYDDAILMKNVEDDIVPVSVAERVRRSHMELTDTKLFLEGVDGSNLKDVILIHLSGKNSRREAFCEAVRRIVGVPVYAAEAGKTLLFLK